MMNKKREPVTFTVSLEEAPTGVTVNGLNEPVTVGPEATEKATVMIRFAKEQYEGPTDLIFTIKTDQSEKIRKQRIKFLGPDANFFLDQKDDAAEPETEGTAP